jgi:RNA polymerase sigma-70 factor (sigma-E family)
VERSAAAWRLEAVQTVPPVDVGTELTLDALYRAHAAGAVRFALMLTGDRALAEDLVQEAFVRVAAKLDSLRDPSAFKSYLTRAVANLAKSHFRHRQVEARHERTVDAKTLVIDAVDLSDDDELLMALRRLPMQQRAVLVLRYYDDCTVDDIATTLDIPPGTVKSQLSRALARLRKEYGRE